MKRWTMKVQLTRSRALNYKMRSAKRGGSREEGAEQQVALLWRSAWSPAIDSSNNNKNTAAAPAALAAAAGATNRSKFPPDAIDDIINGAAGAAVHPVGLLNRFLELCSRSYVGNSAIRAWTCQCSHSPLLTLLYLPALRTMGGSICCGSSALGWCTPAKQLAWLHAERALPALCPDKKLTRCLARPLIPFPFPVPSHSDIDWKLIY